MRLLSMDGIWGSSFVFSPVSRLLRELGTSAKNGAKQTWLNYILMGLSVYRFMVWSHIVQEIFLAFCDFSVTEMGSRNHGAEETQREHWREQWGHLRCKCCEKPILIDEGYVASGTDREQE